VLGAGKLTATRRDWALAGICALLVLGTVFVAFGMSSWLFRLDWNAAWVFWLLGLGMWLFSLGFFFLFMNDPYPRHRRVR
jgi:hypothetical protein